MQRKGFQEPLSLSTLQSSDESFRENVQDDDPENQRIFSVLKLSHSLRKELEALQTIDPAIDVRLSDIGEITLTNDPNKHHITSQLFSSLMSKIPRECESLTIKRQLTKETLDDFIEEQQSSKSCLIRYHRHMKQEPAYVFCWIHRHLIIVLSRGGETCTGCGSRLEWIECMAEKGTTNTSNFFQFLVLTMFIKLFFSFWLTFLREKN